MYRDQPAGPGVATPLDLSSPWAVHVVGAGGAGMSAIASVLAAMGHAVTGSDLRDSPIVARLRAEGVPVAIGHDPANLGAAEVVAVSSAIGDTNPEVRAARDSGIPVVRRKDILPAIASGRRTIAVAGTHGKTTISSMLALVMVEAGLDPSFIIGGDVNEIGTGACWGDGDWFVVEADESDLTFLSLNPEVAVVANVEPDHLDAYGDDRTALESAFARFLASAERSVVCADDETAARLGAAAGAVSYGTSPDADYRMTDLVVDHAGHRLRSQRRRQEAGPDGAAGARIAQRAQRSRCHCGRDRGRRFVRSGCQSLGVLRRSGPTIRIPRYRGGHRIRGRLRPSAQ